jgi:anti-sigma B factor antagonist
MEGIQVSAEVAGSRNHISIIKVGGYIDTTTSSELERALDTLLKQGRFFIIVDLGNVDYISSAGWGIFISEIKSIRENGGDLKLVRMVPDVYEIFELLEFHHILDVYDSIDEAINKFEVLESAGQPVAKEVTFPKAEPEPEPEPFQSQPQQQETAAQQQPAQSVDTMEQTAKTSEDKTEIMPAQLSLSEKIKLIIKKNPEYGAFQIKKELNSVNYGFMRIGWFAVKSELKKLGFNSKTKRYDFATRSAAR